MCSAVTSTVTTAIQQTAFTWATPASSPSAALWASFGSQLDNQVSNTAASWTCGSVDASIPANKLAVGVTRGLRYTATESLSKITERQITDSLLGCSLRHTVGTQTLHYHFVCRTLGTYHLKVIVAFETGCVGRPLHSRVVLHPATIVKACQNYLKSALPN